MNEDPRQIFVVEANELLSEMETALLRCEDGAADEETVNSIFRAAHTIKGSAGMVGFDPVVGFTHLVETVLDRVRMKALRLDAQVAALLINCKDHILNLVTQIAAEQDTADLEKGPASIELTSRLRDILGDSKESASVPAADKTPEPPKGPGIDTAASHELSTDTDSWHISVRFSQNVLRDGMDPVAFIRYLKSVGTLASVHVMDEGLPPADQYDATSCYVGFEIRLETHADKARIESAFDFVRDDCTLHIIPPHSRIDAYARLLIELPDDDCALGEMLIQCGSLTRRELDLALVRQRYLAETLTSQPPMLGEILIEERMVAPRVVEMALAKQSLNRDGDMQGSTRPPQQESRSIRIDSQKLERLIDLIGELIIAGASTNLIAREAGLTALTQSTFRLARLVEAVRDQTLELRMVQIGATFARFRRIVRDVALELHKDILLQISGAETELDKTLVEQMNDPLMHLVRNAIDHGIEDADTRTAHGKNPQATIRLTAYHDSGAVVIEVSDDGGGLNRERILQKARERGVVGENDLLTDSEITDLIFEPGFSTAQQITNLSGRGVGLDVVKRNIVALRGTLQVESREGEGTTVRIRLPLTLAIIDGFQVRVGTAAFVIPLDMVEECVALKERDTVGAQRFTNLRGKPLPFVRLRELYSIDGEPAERESIVVVRCADRRVGIVVDELLGELQTVIKPLSRLFKHVNSIGGSTILGSGRVALILDVPNVIKQCLAACSPRAAIPVSNVLAIGHGISPIDLARS